VVLIISNFGGGCISFLNIGFNRNPKLP